jgi:GcvH upstream region-like protein
MLAFFRRYQKALLIVVTGVIITSFSFFGAFRTYRQVGGFSDRIAGKWIDGKLSYEKEIQKLVRFLETDFTDLWIVEGRGVVNLLNDGIVREFFQSGSLELIKERFFPLFEEELKEKIKSHKQYRPYVHPQKAIGMENLWKQIFPAFYEDYHKFLKEEDPKEAFNYLVALFLEEGVFPPSSIREMLSYQQKQYRNLLIEDPTIQSGDFSLFYAKNLSDWFGKKFTRILAQVIYNSALYAKDRGYKVSYQEASVHIQLVAKRHFDRLYGEKSGAGDFEKFYRKQIALLGLDERELVLLWQKMLYARKLFQDVGGGVFVDASIYKDFHDFASREVTLTLYELPKALQFKHEEDVEKWIFYREAVTGKSDDVKPPTVYLPIEKIQAKAASLLEKKFLVKVAQIDTKELSLEIPLRKVWDFEVEEANFALLKEEFPSLASSKTSNTVQGRALALKSLTDEEREKVDSIARQKILEAEPDLILSKITKANFSVPQIITVPKEGDLPIFGSLKNREALLEALESSDERLSYYTENGVQFYRFQVIDRASDYTIMSFEDAEKKGVLHALLEKKKTKPTYQGEKKALFVSFMNEMREKVMRGDISFEEEKPLQGELLLLPKSPSLEELYRPIKKEVKVERKELGSIFEERIFNEQPNSWSEVIVKKEENPFFYQIKENRVLEEKIAKSVEEATVLLGREARMHLIKEILDRIKEKGVLFISDKEEDGS